MPPSPFKYQLIRSRRRRTVAIKVSPGTVEVRAPYGVSQQEIDQFVSRKQGWIAQHLQRFAAQPKRTQPVRQYLPGEQFQFMGRNYPLQISTGSKHAVTLSDDALIVTLNRRTCTDRRASTTRRLLEGWYRAQALAYLTPLSEKLAARVGKPVGNVAVKRTRSKWGHCTSRGDLQYNWLIMAAPEPVIFYLVAHEVSHLVHHNHSRAFWAQVAQLCSDWQQQRDWLKQQGYLLQV